MDESKASPAAKQAAPARDPAWRQANKARIREYFAAYYARKRQAISERRKQRYASDAAYRADCKRRSRERVAKLKAQRAMGQAA